MKKEIRRGVFETNSSSVHSLTMCNEEDFEAWKKGTKIWHNGSRGLVTIEEYEKAYQEAVAKDKSITDRDDFNRWFGYQDYDEYMDDCDFEHFEETFTSKNGDTIIAFGYYGFD